VLGPVNLTMPGGFSPNRDRTQSIPGYAPPGFYAYNSYVGIYPDDVWHADHFGFQKLALASGDQVENWENTGESLESWALPEYDDGLPDEFIIKGIFPNPFNASTVISYSLPIPNQVSLSVYDISGRIVSELVNEWQSSGIHTFTFDASSLSSGVYFVHFSGEVHSTVQKFVLVK